MTNLEHYEKELKENGRDEYPCTMFTIREDLSDEEMQEKVTQIIANNTIWETSVEEVEVDEEEKENV